MAQLGNFNPDAIQDDGRGAFDIMPAGWYVAQVIESDLVPTKSGSGQMLKLTFEIIEGPCARRRVWANLNIVNASREAQEIGQRDLKRLCVAIGHQGVLTDSEALHFKPLRIRLGIERREGYDPRNDVKAYEGLSSAGAPRSAASEPQQQSGAYEAPRQQATAGGSRPWK